MNLLATASGTEITLIVLAEIATGALVLWLLTRRP